jgi:hypothetical protein
MKNKLERFTLVHVHSHPSLIFQIKVAPYLGKAFSNSKLLAVLTSIGVF